MEWIFMVIGLFTIAGALFDWDWFMLSRRARWLVGIFGRDGARIFYALLGVGFIVFGGMALFGLIDLSS
ncbi:MAG: immunity 17 family protein [Anaerolineae bacterium]